MKYRTAIITLLAITGALLATNPVLAAIQAGADSARGSEQPIMLFGDSGIFSEITNVLLFVIGAIAVIMIVIGGLRYVISGGDAKQVDAAKNTILYAIIGIIVAILAYAIINFITGAFVGGNGQGNSLDSTSPAGNSGTGSSTR